LGSPPARAADPEVLVERWDLVKINDGPVGHVHTVVKRLAAADGPVIESTVTTHMETRRGKDTVVSDEVSVTTERPDGSLVSLKSRKTEGGKETAVEVAFAGEKAVIATTEMGQRREATVPLPKGTVGPWKAERIPVEAGPESVPSSAWT
jgi:hypothetical protein